MNQTNSQCTTVRGVGLAASVPEQVILGAAREVRQRAYHSFWLNNPPGAAALHTLGEVAQRELGIWLGVGVIPLSHEGPGEIVSKIEGERVPLERFYLGIGSGS